MMNYDNVKTTQIQIRLPENLKRDLQVVARHKGLNVSQFLRNAIEELLRSQKVPVRQQEKSPKLTEPTSYHSFNFRCSMELQEAYQEACATKSLRASGHLRTFMQDFVYLLTDNYPEVPSSMESKLAYLQMFLRNEMQKHNYVYEDTYVEPIDVPKDEWAFLPALECVGKASYRVYETSTGLMYTITFKPY